VKIEIDSGKFFIPSAQSFKLNATNQTIVKFPQEFQFAINKDPARQKQSHRNTADIHPTQTFSPNP
jgi:hypothetical protein